MSKPDAAFYVFLAIFTLAGSMYLSFEFGRWVGAMEVLSRR